MNNSVKIKHKEILPVYVRGLYYRKYTLRQASESTGYSIDHLCRLRKKYALMGDVMFEHGNARRIPKNKTDPKLAEKIVLIYSKSYSDVNFSYFCRCLSDFENIKKCFFHCTHKKVIVKNFLYSMLIHQEKRLLWQNFNTE